MHTVRLTKARRTVSAFIIALGLTAGIGGASSAQADDWGWRRREQAQAWQRERALREQEIARERELARERAWREQEWRRHAWRERHEYQNYYAPNRTDGFWR